MTIRKATATPAVAIESANASPFTRVGLTPIRRSASWSCATANTARPKKVWVRNSCTPTTIVIDTRNGTTRRMGKSTGPSLQVVSEYAVCTMRQSTAKISTNAVGNSIAGGATPLFLVVVIRRHHGAGHVCAWSQDGDATGLLPLLEVAAADAVVLHSQHPRLSPFAVLGETDLADVGIELGLVHVVRKLGLVQSTSRLDRLFQHLHHCVGIWRQIVAEWVAAFLDGSLLVLGEKLFQEGELSGDLGRKCFVIDEAVQQRSELRLQCRELRAYQSAAEHPRFESDLVRRAHHAGRIRRIGGDKDQIGVGCLNRTHNR